MPLSPPALPNYTDFMWRRLTRVFVVWISLIGLMPAAMACAQTMADRDCCPPGQQMPCDEEQAPASVEAAACCATANVAPAVVKAASEQVQIDAAALDVLDDLWVTLHSFDCLAARNRGQHDIDTPDIPPDLSLTYLQTGRLRL